MHVKPPYLSENRKQNCDRLPYRDACVAKLRQERIPIKLAMRETKLLPGSPFSATVLQNKLKHEGVHQQDMPEHLQTRAYR
jgi:hypothetical protein